MKLLKNSPSLNKKRLILIWAKGLFAFVFLFILSYLAVLMFMKAGLKNQTELALLSGGIMGFIITITIIKKMGLIFERLGPFVLYFLLIITGVVFGLIFKCRDIRAFLVCFGIGYVWGYFIPWIITAILRISKNSNH